MPGPLDGMFYVHEAMLAEVNWLEGAAKAGDKMDELVSRLDFFTKFNEWHMTGEENHVFPRVESHLDVAARSYLFDHSDDRELLQEIKGLTDKVKAGEDGAEERLKRQTIALTEHLDLHIRKENELILPLIADVVPDQAEMGALIGKIIGEIPAEAMPQVVPWIVRNTKEESAINYTRMVRMVMPPEVVDAAMGWIKNGVPDERWNALTGAIAELNG